MNDEFSVLYVLRDLMPFAVTLGVCCFFVFGHLLTKDGSKNNLTAKERKRIWIGFVVGIYLTASPSITSKILFDFFPAESYCEFQDGRDQRLKEPCVLHVKIKKIAEHRSGEQ